MAVYTEQQLLARRFTREERLRILILTMSDRAHRGDYPDRSGPSIKSHLERFVRNAGVHVDCDSAVLPDDSEGIHRALRRAISDGTHVIFTTGGTGVGPRDNTPEVILQLADKTIPGIMEHIRAKYAEDKPLTQLSRSVAAIAGSTLIYALPGSPKAIDEYMPEIQKTLGHLLCVLHGLDAH